MSGNHSQIEKDVLHYLLKGSQPIIIALARGLKTRLDMNLKEEVEKERLLFVAPFTASIIRVTQETANKRNELMAELAERLFVGYAQPGGNIERLVLQCLRNGKRVETIDVEENRDMITAGAVAI